MRAPILNNAAALFEDRFTVTLTVQQHSAEVAASSVATAFVWGQLGGSIDKTCRPMLLGGSFGC